MLVRFVETHHRGLERFAPGDVLDPPVAEAMRLMRDGVAVAVNHVQFAREVRAGHERSW
jgi:hypothetical protein